MCHVFVGLSFSSRLDTPPQGGTTLNAKFAARVAINARVAQCLDAAIVQKLTRFLILVRGCDCNHMLRARQCSAAATQKPRRARPLDN